MSFVYNNHCSIYIPVILHLFIVIVHVLEQSQYSENHSRAADVYYRNVIIIINNRSLQC